MAKHQTCQLPARLKHFFLYNCVLSSFTLSFFNPEQHSRKLTLNSAPKLRRRSSFPAFFFFFCPLSHQYFPLFFLFRLFAVSSLVFSLISFFFFFFDYALAPFRSALSDRLGLAWSGRDGTQ